MMGCRKRLLTSSLKTARSLSAPRWALAHSHASMWQLLLPELLLLLGKSACH